jgi:hypothetical protein
MANEHKMPTRYQRFDAKQVLLHRLRIREDRVAIPIKVVMQVLNRGGGGERTADPR